MLKALRGFAVAVIGLWSSVALALPLSDVVADTLVRERALPLAADPTRVQELFARAIQHEASSRRDGVWTRSGEVSTWRYQLAADWAKTLSFHANRLSVPQGATLALVNEHGRRFPVGATDLQRGELWSRTVTGAAIGIEAVMPTQSAESFELEIDEVYAGFKLPFQTYASGNQAKALGGSNACGVNYMCKTGLNNPGNAAVAFIYRGTGACSGTIVNNTASNRRMLLLTANHCRIQESWRDAAGVVVYWNAVTPCGEPLENFIDSGAPTTTGGTTLVISGTVSGTGLSNTGTPDSWLIELNNPHPAGVMPYWAGINATDDLPGAQVYSINHSNQQTKQYTRFNAPSKVGLAWNLSIVEGDVLPGASGSGLFLSDEKLIGVSSGGSSGLSCPAAGATYKRMGTFFDEMKTHLDPSNTGSRSYAGVGPAPVVVVPTLLLASDRSTATTGDSATLTWTPTGASSCAASGDWTGLKASSGGSETVSLGSTAGTRSYSLTCTNTGGSVTKVVTVTVSAPPPPSAPSLSLTSSKASASPGDDTTLTWAPSGAISCIAGGDWSGSKTVTGGSETVSLGSAAGTRSYSLTCSNSGGSVSRTVSVAVSAPPPPPAATLTLAIDRSTAAVGETYTLTWTSTNATTCSASGAWSGPRSLNSSEAITADAAGTKTYSLTCTGAGGSATRSTSVLVNAASGGGAGGGTAGGSTGGTAGGAPGGTGGGTAGGSPTGGSSQPETDQGESGGGSMPWSLLILGVVGFGLRRTRPTH